MNLHLRTVTKAASYHHHIISKHLRGLEFLNSEKYTKKSFNSDFAKLQHEFETLSSILQNTIVTIKSVCYWSLEFKKIGKTEY